MTLKRMFFFLIATMFVLPLFIVAEDDFEDDEFGSFEDEEKAEPFDAEESAAKKKAEDKEQSDAAMRDLLGDEEKEDKADEPVKEEKKVDKKKKNDAESTNETPKKAKEPVQKGFKPVILVKGGFTLIGNYKEKSTTGIGTTSKGSMFGSVDEGLLGAEFIGDHVIAKGTMNLRTNNPLINKGNNPLAKINLHSIQNGADNALYEIYGGIRFFDIFVKAGKMIPEYGLMDMYQNLGMGFSTPFLTRSLVAVEGFIPETDAGISFGYKGTFAEKHTILAGLMLGTGSIASDFWNTDKTMGIYGRLGYMHEYFQIAFGIQHKMDYYFKTVAKKPTFTGIGLHLNVSPKIGNHEISAPITFDYNLFGLIKGGVQQKSVNGILFSAAPGYAYCFDSEWADKIALAVRFDLVKGVYKNGATDYLDYDKYSLDGVIFRIGATANFFVKEMKGVHSYAGVTFLIQPERKIVGSKGSTPSEYDYGFTTLMLSAGAEM
ncbi:MAG TPA: hypothetical protein PKG52_07610 [bacterium]|nr:hypothetical protein [bacterium]